MTFDASEVLFYGPIHGEGKRVQTVRLAAYPGGEPLVEFPRGSVVDRVLVRPASMLAFTSAMFWIDALVERGHRVPELVLPFFPGARQDRLTREGDFLFTAKSVAKMVNARNFPRVIVVDPHSDVVPALVDRCKVITLADVVASCLGGTPSAPSQRYGAVIAPDGGAEKRALGVAKLLGVPLLHAWKRRDVATGALSGFGLEQVSPGLAPVLVVDDICDGGGTFVGLADLLALVGIKADLLVTHGIFSQGLSHLAAKFGAVTCTDTVLGPWRRHVDSPKQPGPQVLSICEDLLVKGELR